MGIAFRVKSVEHIVDTVDAQGRTVSVDLSLDGNITAHVEYVDTEEPEVVLAERRFTFSAALTPEQMQGQINGYGLSVRDARLGTLVLQGVIGDVIPLVEAETEPESEE